MKVIRQGENIVPESMQRLLLRAAGTNPFGEPMYRFVWGPSRIELVGGLWADYNKETGALIREKFEMRRLPKYGAPLFNEDRFYVERWYPPPFFGPKADWTNRTLEREGLETMAVFGPYPSRGDYAHFFTVENKNNEFIQLTWPRALWLASVVWSSERAHKRTLQDQRDAMKAKEEQRSKDDLEVLESTIPAFNYQPTVTVL